jgi:hypothetical protein
LSISQKAGLFRFVKTYGTAGSFTRHLLRAAIRGIGNPSRLIRRKVAKSYMLRLRISCTRLRFDLK